MNFTSQELRNNKNSLLRRVQRQMDSKEQTLPTPKVEEDNFLLRSFKSKPTESCFAEKPKERKETRLGLMKRRYSKY